MVTACSQVILWLSTSLSFFLCLLLSPLPLLFPPISSFLSSFLFPCAFYFLLLIFPTLLISAPVFLFYIFPFFPLFASVFSAIFLPFPLSVHSFSQRRNDYSHVCLAYERCIIEDWGKKKSKTILYSNLIYREKKSIKRVMKIIIRRRIVFCHMQSYT